jgi:hypothetical protein
MSDLETKKRALVAESEVFRETLKLELHNLRLYGARTKQKFTSMGKPNRLLLLMAPFAGLLFRKKKSSLMRRVAMGLLSYQVSNRIVPFLSALLSTNKRSAQTSSVSGCDEETVMPSR